MMTAVVVVIDEGWEFCLARIVPLVAGLASSAVSGRSGHRVPVSGAQKVETGHVVTTWEHQCGRMSWASGET
jgi:hypothetical protein